MADTIFRGDALKRKNKWTITVADTWATNDTATVTINGKSLTLTVGTDSSTAQVATAIKEMWNGDTQTGTGDHTFSETGNNVADFDKITAAVASSVVTLTGDDKGKPFTLTTSESTAGDGTISEAETVTVVGGEVFDDANNWDTGAVPVDNDDVFFEATDADLLYNLSNSGVGLDSLNVRQSFRGTIGLPLTNADGYREYRTRYLTLGDAAIATVINVGEGTGDGSGRLLIDNGAGQATLNVWNTGTPLEQGIESLLFLGTHASNVVNVHRGSLGIAVLAGESATVATLNVGYVDNREGDAVVRCGSGVSLTTLNQTGGVVELNAGLTTVTQSGGELTINAGNVTTINATEGVLNYNGTGTLGTTNVHPGAAFNLSRGQGTVTMTTINLYAGAIFRAPKGRFGSAPTLRLNGCTIADVTVEMEDDFDVDHV